MRILSRVRRHYPILVAVCLLAACSRDPKTLAGGWTDTETGTKVTGLIMSDDGRPAAGALVLLRPNDYLGKDPTQNDTIGVSKSKGSILDGICDSTGHFAFDSVLTGHYSLEARERELKGVLIKFDLNEGGGALQLPTGTARPVGIITGRVKFSDSVSGPVLVRIYGLERAVVANRSGLFTFGGIPEGTYTLQFTSLDPFAPPVDEPGVHVSSDSATDAGETTLLRGLKQSFRIVDGFLDLDGVDSTNPLIFENGAFINPLDGAYLWAKASMGHLDLRGTIVSYSKDSGDATLTTNLHNCERLVKLARSSGMKSILDPVSGAQHRLAPAASGKLEDLVPVASEGSLLMIKEARKATPAKPLVVICGANMTTVANALLQDPTIADRMVVFGANNGNYNMDDSLALAVVAKKARLVEWARDYVWSTSGTLWQPSSVYLTNGFGQLMTLHSPKDTLNAIWSFAFYADFGPATFLYQRKVWSTARGADYAGYPMLANLSVTSPFDWVDIPDEANDWKAIQDEFLATVDNPAAYYPWPLAGGVEAESYSASSGVKVDTLFPDASISAADWIKAGWAEYSVQIDSAGSYAVDIRHQSATAAVLLLSEGAGVPVSVNLPASTTWDTVTSTIPLDPGLRTIRVESSQGSFILDWIRFRKK